MTAQKAEQLIAQGIITDGMVVKVNAALDAARWISPAGAMPISFLLCLTACRLARILA